MGGVGGMNRMQPSMTQSATGPHPAFLIRHIAAEIARMRGPVPAVPGGFEAQKLDVVQRLERLAVRLDRLDGAG